MNNESQFMGFFNCGDLSHMVKKCPKEFNMVKPAKERLKYKEGEMDKTECGHSAICVLLSAGRYI